MINYIIDSAQSIIAPSSLSLSIDNIELLESSAAVTITGAETGTVINIPGTALPVTFHENIDIATTGRISLVVNLVNGSQEDHRLFDDINIHNAGLYPGRWGNGNGSLPNV